MRDMRPHRGALILVLGILGLVSCGIFTGLPAWIMGKADLSDMDAGLMDPEGRGITNAGMILGMITTILTGLSILLALGFFALMFLGIGIESTRH